MIARLLTESELKLKKEDTRPTRRDMSDINDLMDFISASLGTTLDEIYQRLIDCDFGLEVPELAMFTVALLNAMAREGRGNRPTDVVLMLAFGESGTAQRSRNRLMRLRRGEMSGHDLVREPGLGEQRDYRLGEMPMPIRLSSSAQPLFGSKGHAMGRPHRILWTHQPQLHNQRS